MRITLRGFSCAVLLAGMLCSCQKELAQVEQPETEINMVAAEFSAVTEAGMPTRMTLGEGLKPAWEAGDKLAVWDGSLVTAFSVKKAEGSFAKFDGQVAEGSDEYYALFPHTEGIAFDAEAKAFKTLIPSEQIISQGDSVCASALMGMAYAPKPAEGQTQFAFRNVCGLIKVDVPESGKIASIVISSNGEETFVGEGTVSLQKMTEGQLTQTIPVFTPAVGAGNTVTLRPEGENATFEKGSYYAVVAPVVFQTGFSINMVRTDGAAGKISTDQPMKVVRNGGANLKDIVAVSDWSLEIWTKEQLFAWGRNWGRLDKVTLMADIDMEGDLWTPVGDGDNWFSGVFDGNGKRIYNLNVNTDGYAGFIGHLAGEGCVKNLTIGAKPDEKVHDGSSSIVHTPSKDETAWSYIGLVGKLSGRASVESVTNYARLEIPESDFNVKACMGGIAGFSDSSNSISKCVNYGAINYLAAKGNTVNVIGGIVSKIDKSSAVSECENHGKITNGNGAVLYIGGIVGNTRSNNYDNAKPVKVTACKNTGALEINAAASSEECGVGGICGMLQNADLATCTNKGKITLSTSSATNIYIGGIAGMRRNKYDTSITDCVNGVEDMSSSLFEYNTTGGDVKFGGILGHCHKSSGKLTITGCTNHSPISLSNAGAVFQVGGISGAIAESVILTVSDCRNTGDMNFSSVASGQKCFGGLFGWLRYNVTGATDVFTVSSSTNSGNLTTSASTGEETDIAGIVGYATNNIKVESCINNGTVSTSGSATKPRVGGIVGVAHSNTKYENCTNNASVTNASDNGAPYIGGIAGYGNTATFSGCTNKGDVMVTKAGSNFPCVGGILGHCAADVSVNGSYNEAKISCSVNQSRLGGIVGNADGVITIADCENKSTAEIRNSGASGTYVVGGIVGRILKGGSQILRTINRGAVKAEGNKSCLAGGIVGISEGGNATETQRMMDGCKNYGSVTTGNDSAGYACLGGMVGRTLDGMLVIKNCENHGPVTINGTRSDAATSAGGIIGYSAHQTNLDNNLNTAAITASATNVKVGGIWGHDFVRDATYTVAGTVKNCTNKGNVKAEAAGSSVGGLFGIISKTSVENETNTNYGNVLCYGGALAGASKISSWSAKVGETVTVNGNTGAEGTPVSNWLCPSADNPLSAEYVK